jgi:hypothetical protein
MNGQFLAGKPRFDWARRTWAAFTPGADEWCPAGEIFECDGRIEANRRCVAELDDECVHPPLAVYRVHDNEHHSRRKTNLALDQWLEHTLDRLPNGFVPLPIMRDAENKDLFVFVGIVSDDNAAELELFACGLSLNSAAGEVQGNDEWNAGVYESI